MKDQILASQVARIPQSDCHLEARMILTNGVDLKSSDRNASDIGRARRIACPFSYNFFFSEVSSSIPLKLEPGPLI